MSEIDTRADGTPLDRTAAPFDEAAMELVAGYLDRAGVKYGRLDDGTIVARFGEAEEASDLAHLYVLAGGWAGAGLGLAMRYSHPVDRSEWVRTVARCNAWNARFAVPKAQLVIPDADGGAPGQIVLDGWLPLGSTPDAAAVDTFMAAAIRGGLGFVADLERPPDDASR